MKSIDFYKPQYWVNENPDVLLRPKAEKKLHDRNAQDEPCHCRKHSPAKPQQEIPSGNPQLDKNMPNQAKTERRKYVCGKDSIMLICKKCGEPHLLDYFCNSRICPTCAKRHQNELFHKIEDFVKNFRVPYGMAYRFITLTLKKTTFERDSKRAFKALAKIWHNILEPNGVGAITHLELAPGGMIHWHMIYIGKFIKKQDLKDAWFKITKDSFQVDINEIPKWNMCKAVLELSKYITKFSETPANMLFAFYMLIKNNRLLRTFGVFFAYRWDENKQLLCPNCGNADFIYAGVQSYLFRPVPDCPEFHLKTG